jgi:hypothetical protein
MQILGVNCVVLELNQGEEQQKGRAFAHPNQSKQHCSAALTSCSSWCERSSGSQSVLSTFRWRQ